MHTSAVLQILILGLAIGGIPFGVLVAKLFGLPDPRYVGSGNIGATNMLRTGSKKAALLTLLLDAGKGALVVYLVSQLFPMFDVARAAVDSCGLQPTLENCATANPHLTALAVLAVALGHMYSPFLKLKGGKGVATLFGGALVFSGPVAMASLCVWLIALFTTRYVSLASIGALVVAPLVAWLRVDAGSAAILALAAAISIWKHRENIGRLRRGFEPKIAFGKSA